MKDTIICRCEEVTLNEICEHLSSSLTSKEIKLKTRAGMGICQGKTCRPLIDRIVSKKTNTPIPDQSSLTSNFPIRPISLTDLAKIK